MATKSSSQLGVYPTDQTEWKALPNRFEKERSNFNFDTLAFAAASSSVAMESNSMTFSGTTTTSEGAGAGAGDSSSSALLFSSREFTNHLTLEPSQRLASEARTSFRTRRTSGMSLRSPSITTTSNSSSCSKDNTTTNTILSSSKRRVSYAKPGDFTLHKLADCDHLVGREAELQRLQQLYDDPNVKMTTVVAPSGCGKSVLVVESMAAASQQQQLQQQATTTTNLLIGMGKFDLPNHRADPYQAIVEALTALIHQISSNRPLLKELRQIVQSKLGEETEILLELVPPLIELVSAIKKRPKAHPKQVVHVEAKKKWRDTTTTTSAPIEPMPPDESEEGTKEGEISQSSQVVQAAHLSTSKQKQTDRGITERAARLQNVLVEFVRIIATERHPVTLVLDDVQWAGPASIHLMDALLSDLNLPHFYLLTTCRQEYLPFLNENLPHDPANINNTTNDVKDEAIKINQPLLDLLVKHKDTTGRMVLQGLSVESVQVFINTLLRMDDATRTLSLAEIVHQKTDGNPFFILHFMNILVDERLLTYEMGTLCWQWLEGDIQSQNVAANVSEAVHKRLQTLPLHNLMILQVASCFGNSFEQPTLHYVLQGLQSVFQSEWNDIDWEYAVDNLDSILMTLLDIRVIELQYGGRQTFDFAHDQIQAAASRSIPSERRVPLQVAIGRRLIEGLNSFHRDQYLFRTVQLCGAAGVEEMSAMVRHHFSFWAFLAGDAALKQGAFHLALSFFVQAIACLGGKPFERDLELALPLFSGAAEAAYCIGSNSVNQYIDQVQSQTSIPEAQKIRVSLVQLKVLSGKRDFHGCAMAFRKTIKGLGAAKFAKNPSMLSVLYQMIKTSNLLKNYDQQKLLALPECTNPAIESALSVETNSIVPLILSNPNLYIVATCKAVQWSLLHGQTKDTPPGLACVAALIVALFGDNKKGLEVGEAALALCEEQGYKIALPKTVGFVFGFVRHWSRPMHEFATPMRYAIDIGLRLGCMDDCAFLVNTYGLLLVLTSTNTLTESIKDIEGFRHMMKEMNHQDHLSFTECNLQFAHKLAYQHEDVVSLDGDIMNETVMRQLAQDNHDVALTGFVNYFKMMLNFYFGHPVQAAESGEAVIGFGFSFGQGAHLVPRCTFFIGLSNLLAYKMDGKAKRIRTIKAMEKRVKNWVKQSNPNVLHFLHLLQAELHSVKKNWEQAKIAFSSAIATSSRTGFKLDFALGNELLALFYWNPKNKLHDTDEARFYMKEAIHAYASYGAAHKASHLEQQFANMLQQQKQI
jgi:histidine kinase